eukprot:scaffold95033_cov25-Phaeocystis_antarctica.AAC.1
MGARSAAAAPRGCEVRCGRAATDELCEHRLGRVRVRVRVSLRVRARVGVGVQARLGCSY